MRQESTEASKWSTISILIFVLSLAVLAYVLWTVATTPAADVRGMLPRLAVEIAGVAAGAVLVVASAGLMVRLRSGALLRYPSGYLEGGLDDPEIGTDPDPLFAQRLASASSSAAVDPTHVPLLETSALQKGYEALTVDISVSFVTSLARHDLDLSGFLHRATELLDERCAWGSGSVADRSARDQEAAHVSVFLLDEQGEWATMQAASSVPGKEAVLRGHRLHRGEETSVGWVMTERRLWRGAGSGGVYPAIPGLSEMRSAIALPMFADGSASDAAGSEMVGVLDIRSAQADAFSHVDVDGLTRIAGYLGLAIATVRRLWDSVAAPGSPAPFQETAKRLALAADEAEVYAVITSALRDFDPMRILIVRTSDSEPGPATGEGQMDALQIVVDTPEVVLSEGRRGATAPARTVSRTGFADLTPPSLTDIVIMGLAFDGPLWVGELGSDGRTGVSQRPALIGQSGGQGLHVESPELAGALQELATSSDVGALAFVPLQSRDRAADKSTTVGGILVLFGATHRFSPMERYLHELLADLGGVAIERGRLLAGASMRLEHERLLAEIRARLRASFDPDVILRATVQELGRVLGAELTGIELSTTPEAAVTAIQQEL